MSALLVTICRAKSLRLLEFNKCVLTRFYIIFQVVWRKLGDASPEKGSVNPLYENIPARQSVQTSSSQQKSVSQPIQSRNHIRSPPATHRPTGRFSNNQQSTQGGQNHLSYTNHKYPLATNSANVLYSEEQLLNSDLAPGMTQTIHSQNLPSHHQYRSPPPPPVNHNSSRPPPPPPNYHYQDRTPPPPPSQQNYENFPPPLPQKPSSFGQPSYHDRQHRADRVSATSVSEVHKTMDQREMSQNYNDPRGRRDHRETNFKQRSHPMHRDNSREKRQEYPPDTARSWDQGRRPQDYSRDTRQSHSSLGSYH